MRRHGATVRGLLVLTSLAAVVAGVLGVGTAAANHGGTLRIDLQTGANPQVNQPYTFTVTMQAANGSPETTYTGTVTLTASPDGTITPNPYTFTAADQGRHTFTVTFPTGGNHTITATDNQGHTATAQGINVGGAVTGCNGQATLTISPTSVTPGQTVTLTGSGYNANETIAIREDGGATAVTATANASGQFTTTASASQANGTHTVTATGNSSARCGQATYTVSGSSTTCTGTTCFSLSPSTAAPGQTITLTGTGYQANESVIITADNGSQLATATTDAAGSFTTTGVVPTNLTAGSHVITARGNTSQRTDSDTLVVSGTNVGNCPAGYTFVNGQCVLSNQAGACPQGYFFDGTRCTLGSYAGGACPPGYVFNGYACAFQSGAVPTAPVPVAQTPQAVQPAAQSRVPFTGNRTTRMVAIALSLLIGGLLLLSARTVVGSRRARA